MILLQKVTNDESTNLLVTVIINLFVLSMVSERLVNFVKLNFQKIYESNKLNEKAKKIGSSVFGNFRDIENDKNAEKLRERGILNWAIFCSLIVAFFAKADLFYLINFGKLPVGVTTNPFKIADGVSFIGICLTALFISLGSKFWHDLLDILYFYKTTRQKLADDNLSDFDTSDSLQEFVETPYSEIYKNIIAQNSNIFSDPNVLYTLRGATKGKKGDTPCLVVHVKSKANFNIPPYLKYQLPKTNTLLNVRVVVVEDTLPKTFIITNGDGLLVHQSRFIGTACLGLQNREGKKFVLTCNHVLNEDSLTDKGGVLQGDERLPVDVFINKNQTATIGEWHYSLCNYHLDIALVQLEGEEFEDNPTGITNNIYRLKENDKGRLPVTMNGFVSELQEGVIVTFDTDPIPIEYADGIHELNLLIVIGSKGSSGFNYQSSTSISQGGDSGAIIFDSNSKKPIGMIVAGSERYSFAIPLIDIFDEDIFSDLTIL
jgi:hypothetical protein